MARNPVLDETLMGALVALWTAVANAGGAVGFVTPVAPDDVRPVAAEAFARVLAGRDDCAVAFDGAEPIGMGLLVSNEGRLKSHWATIRGLMRHPARRGAGIGATLLAELEAAARDRGLQRVVVTVRAGTGRERFYEAHGYRLEARLQGRLRIGQGDVRDELVMSKLLGDEAVSAARPVLHARLLDPQLPAPAYAHPGDAGLDLHAREDVRLEPGQRAVVPTGVAVALPPGYVGLVHPRSGLAARHGLALVNAPGTVDAGYRGEIKVVVVNLDPSQPVTLVRGERIAQLVVQRVETVRVVEVDALPASDRGEGGFGSTGR